MMGLRSVNSIRFLIILFVVLIGLSASTDVFAKKILIGTVVTGCPPGNEEPEGGQIPQNGNMVPEDIDPCAVIDNVFGPIQGIEGGVPVPQQFPISPCAIIPGVQYTGCDLVRVLAGLPPTSGPDAGEFPLPGDTIIIQPGIYTLAPPTGLYGPGPGSPPANGTGPLVIPGAAAPAFGYRQAMNHLQIISRSGADVTVIQPTISTSTSQALLYILADHVEIGVNNPESGFTFQNSPINFPNIDIGGITSQWVVNMPGALNAIPLAIIPPDQARKNITIRNSFIQNAGTNTRRGALQTQGIAPGAGNGVIVGYPGPAPGAGAPAACAARSIERFRVFNTEFRNNRESGWVFSPCVLNIGGTTEEEQVVFEGNTFDGNGLGAFTGVPGCGIVVTGCVFYQDGLTFDNRGQIQRLLIQNNLFVRNMDNGLNVGASGINAFCQGLPAVLPVPVVGGAPMAAALNGICPAVQNSNGIAAGAPTSMEDILIDGNVAWHNGSRNVTGAGQPNTVGAGMVFANNGQFERVYITNNRDETDPNNLGITGNGGPGLLFLGFSLGATAPGAVASFSGQVPTNPRHPLSLYNNLAGGGVSPGNAGLTGGGALLTDMDEVYIVNNAITENGQWDFEGGIGAGFYGVKQGLIDGLAILISGQMDDVYIEDNDIRLNMGDGALVAPVGRISNLYVNGNYFRNNGAHPFCPALIGINPAPAAPPLCNIDNVGSPLLPATPDFIGNGFSAVLVNDADHLYFDGNVARENLFHGFFVGSLRTDLSDISILNTLSEKNGLGLLKALGTAIPAQTGDGFEIAAFGDITNVYTENSQFLGNGGSGLFIDANSSVTLPTYFPNIGGAIAFGPLGTDSYGVIGQLGPPNSLGDLTQVGVMGSDFSQNGGSSPTGSGNGFFTLADKTTDVNVEDSTAHTNDDHGFLNTTVDDLTSIRMTNTAANGNDNNNDTVGAGFFFDSTEDMVNVRVEDVTGSNNYHGIHFEIRGENARNLHALNSIFENNRNTGILIKASDDLLVANINGNISSCNGEQLTIDVIDRGGQINVSDNRLIGCSGIGLMLNANGVSVTNNDIRDNDVGIVALRAEGNAINQNNIARNELYGIDATGLQPQEFLEATNNWWGEPSGPETSMNPGGFGDEITSKVMFDPWLGEPNGQTRSTFELTQFNIPDTANVGEEVTFNARVENSGSEESIEIISFRVSKDGDLVNATTRTIVLDPGGSTSVTFGFTFAAGGNYTVEVSTGDDSNSSTIEVLGATGVSIEFVCDANDNDRIDDSEIMTCVEFWVLNQIVPGTGEVISDEKIMFLIELWVTNGSIETLSKN